MRPAYSRRTVVSAAAALFSITNLLACSTDNAGVPEAIVTTPTPPNAQPVAINDVATVTFGTSNNLIAVLANDSDSNGGVLAITSLGARSAGGSASISGSGSQVSYTPAAGFVGSETFSYTVSDGQGGSATASVTVTVSPRPVAFSLQLLHASDMEGAGNAITDAPRFSAVFDALRKTMPTNTIALSSGDNYIPGPFYSASADISLRPILGNNAVGAGDIQILNAIGFQASAFGNHDFDQGTTVVANLISRRSFDDNNDGTVDRTYPGLNFPYLSANLGFANDTNLAPRVVPDGQPPRPNSIARSTVITVNGERIGVVGATTPTLATISSSGPNVAVTPAPFAQTPTPEQISALASIIQSEVNLLSNAGINKIILLAHMQQLAIERQLIPLLTGVDILVGGGSDTILADGTDRLRTGDTAADTYPVLLRGADGQPTALVNTDGQYLYVGRLVAPFDANGVLLSESLNPTLNGAYATDAAGVTAVNGTPIPAVQQIADAIGAVLIAREGNILGRATVFLNGTNDAVGVRREETNLGNLTADANIFAAQQFDATTAIALKNGGGIRNAIGSISQPSDSNTPVRGPTEAIPVANKQAGDISQFDAQNALSFNNGLSLINVTAAELKDLLEHGVSGALGAGRFPQIGGMAFSFDLTGTSRTAVGNGTRVRSLVVFDNNGAGAGGSRDVVVQNGAVVGDPNRSFRMVTLSFLSTLGGSGVGGDGYPFPAPAGRSCVFLVDTGTPARPADCTVASGLPAGVQTFAAAGSEQDALAELLEANFAGSTSFGMVDTAVASDTRIQNLANRVDTVLNP